MAHSLTVIFSGIVAFTKHSGGGKYGVVLPATLHPDDRKALDGQQKLREHFPHLVVDRTAIFLGKGQTLDFGFQSEAPGGGGQVDDSQLHMLQMTWALPGKHCGMRPDALHAPASEAVTTVLEIDRGTLASDTETDDWDVDGSILGGPTQTHPVASKVLWTVDGLTADLEIGSTPFGGTGEELVTLPTGTQDVTVKLQNFMAKDVCGQFFPPFGPHDDTDHDFCWYFELLDDTCQAWVKRQLASRSRGTLPIPQRHPREESTKGITQNCMPGQFPDSQW